MFVYNLVVEVQTMQKSNQQVLSEIAKHLADPQRWLDTPLADFGGRRPRELLLSGEHQRLLSCLPRKRTWQTGLDDAEIVVS